MERWSDYRHAILGDYWQHLVDDHQFQEGYDIDIEYAIMQDYLLHGCEAVSYTHLTLPTIYSV